MVTVPWDFNTVTSQHIVKLNSKMDEQGLKSGTYALKEALQQTVLMREYQRQSVLLQYLKDTKE